MVGRSCAPWNASPPCSAYSQRVQQAPHACCESLRFISTTITTTRRSVAPKTCRARVFTHPTPSQIDRTTQNIKILIMSDSSDSVTNSVTNSNNNNNKPEKIKLKFGIERLLASNPDAENNEKARGFKRVETGRCASHESDGHDHNGHVVPCVECVTSMYRCCAIRGGGNNDSYPENTYGHDFLHGFNGLGVLTTGNVYTTPIRPYPTRPQGKYFVLWPLEDTTY